MISNPSDTCTHSLFLNCASVGADVLRRSFHCCSGGIHYQRRSFRRYHHLPHWTHCGLERRASRADCDACCAFLHALCGDVANVRRRSPWSLIPELHSTSKQLCPSLTWLTLPSLRDCAFRFALSLGSHADSLLSQPPHSALVHMANLRRESHRQRSRNRDLWHLHLEGRACSLAPRLRKRLIPSPGRAPRIQRPQGNGPRRGLRPSGERSCWRSHAQLADVDSEPFPGRRRSLDNWIRGDLWVHLHRSCSKHGALRSRSSLHDSAWAWRSAR